MNYFVTAIGTDSGKTLVSAILCEALDSDYWKPIQAGLPKDSAVVKSLVSNPEIKIHNEAYLLSTPASPHAAAKREGVQIDLNNLKALPTDKPLIIEGAGGCLVPINDHDYVIDIAKNIDAEVILVSNLYLGSINHTLLTAHLLKNRNIPVKGIIFNGPPNEESERIILLHTNYRCLLRIQQEQEVTPAMVTRYARLLKANWK